MLWYANKSHTFDILKVEDLPFPILLGRALGFSTLVQTAIHEVAAADEEPPKGGDGPKQDEEMDPNQAN